MVEIIHYYKLYLIFTVNTSANCRVGDKPVCSTDNQTYPSLCHMIMANVTLAYSGKCIDSCKKTPVCGINGISYKSECEAWSGKKLFIIICISSKYLTEKYYLSIDLKIIRLLITMVNVVKLDYLQIVSVSVALQLGAISIWNVIQALSFHPVPVARSVEVQFE